MADKTKIEWATHSFSPWIGCSKVSSGCENCYAAAMSGRFGVTWGPNGTRRRTAESTWKQVENWNRQAGIRIAAADSALNNFSGGLCQPRLGEIERVEADRWRPRVFPSLCDPFEHWGGVIQGTAISTFNDVRRDFFAMIDSCQNLDFLLLTKRPENVQRMWPRWCDADGTTDSGASEFYRGNVWLIYSASDQASLEAGLPHLLACRDLAPVIGLSLEPLIGPIDLSAPLGLLTYSKTAVIRCMPQGDEYPDPRAGQMVKTFQSKLDWVIVGGESGPRARPMDVAWLESIAEQCKAAGVPLFVKQGSGLKAGQQGRIPDRLWSRKEFPRVDR